MAEEVRLGTQPQPDYLALAERLNVTLLAPVRAGHQPRTGVGKVLGFIRTAWTGFRARKHYDVIISDIDRVGLVLAFLLKVSRSRTRHVLICHGKLARPVDTRIMNMLRLHTNVQHVVCYGPQAAEVLKRNIPALADRITVVRHGQDHHFWRPLGGEHKRVVVSAGLFRRDYDTLVDAVDGLDVSVEVAAHSPWVTENPAHPHADAANVRFQRCRPDELRRLYDQALVVAVPLVPTPSQAGSLVIYEAMAMGKPVIVTRTEGQQSLGLVEEGKTGYYVDPFDAERWRQLIKEFLDDPGKAAEVGRQGRLAVEAGLNLEAYANQMAEVLRQSAIRAGNLGQPSSEGVSAGRH